MKEWNEHLLKFRLTNDKLKMEISFKDLEWLFHNSPNNYGIDGNNCPYAQIKRGKRQEFAKWIVEHLLDQSQGEADTMVWSEPFEYLFTEVTESAADFLKYNDDTCDE